MSKKMIHLKHSICYFRLNAVEHRFVQRKLVFRSSNNFNATSVEFEEVERPLNVRVEACDTPNVNREVQTSVELQPEFCNSRSIICTSKSARILLQRWKLSESLKDEFS